ncbi:MAG: ABC transporter ATP-binding protein [Pseudomonadota bacterium]
MIRLHDVKKTFFVKGQYIDVIKGITAVIPSKTSIGLLGRNGAGKSTLMNIIAGTMEPTSGAVRSTGTISWPVGFAGSFHPELTGSQNTRFVARVYGVDTDELVEFARDFSQLGDKFDQPFRTYSSGMRSRLAFGVSMGIDFDTYLVDEVTSVGDAAFKAKSEAIFHDRLKNRGAIMVSHSTGMLRRLCTCGIVLEDGYATYFDTIEEAIDTHERNLEVIELDPHE